MDLILVRKDGTIYNFADYNLSVIDFRIHAPSPRFNFEVSEGQDGVIDTGITFEERLMTASFEFNAVDFLDFNLLRNEIFKLFYSRELFYLIDNREPGKWWLVRSNSYVPEQYLTLGKFSLDFISPSTYSRSIGTSLDPKTFDVELWQIGQGLNADEAQYIHTTTSFQILNSGDVAIDPRKMELTIEFTGPATNLMIINETTGDEWIYNGTILTGDTIRLEGVRSTKNSLSIVRDTNKKVITLAPGNNNFRLEGTSGSFEISFDFRFCYL